ncbi:hypothetical protein Glove_43g23 [Diversispora epigaea]|uniref:HIT domain-containing protein n=1 Tax=Diversispora epigaea TaxID=1348612 RepID=A0A397JPK0_9GLOM|nr:hypothetical protein Glove_43g23 [Diversispora epigaea]
MSNLLAGCQFCKIIQRLAPSEVIYETERTLAFLDIFPLSEGHTLVVPKYHSEFLHELPDEYLADLLPVAKKVAIATGAEQYNVLQNNGPLANQAVEHVHVHVIPKPNKEEGLGLVWKVKKKD